MTDAQPSRGGDAAPLAAKTEAAATPPSGPDARTSPAMTADGIAEVSGGSVLANVSRPILDAAVDSRAVRPGNLFVALPGEHTDGHRYLADAARAGAAAVLVRELPADQLLPGDVAVIQVADPLTALQAVAADWRSRFAPLVVGITGSVAKTSTKDAVAAVLEARFPTLKSEGNENNEIGVPLTLLRLRREHEAAVLEMGMYVAGEIALLARLARPRIGVVTAVHPVHMSRTGTLDAIERAKAELLEALPADGTAILNADDERVRRMASRTVARSITYGFAADADVRADEIESLGPAGMRFALVAEGRRHAARVPTLGRHAVHNALAAAAVGLVAGMTPDEIVAGLAAATTSAHRGQLIPAGAITILDDSYNASPRSMRAALELLASLPGRPIAVLGEMLELGEADAPGHREVGEVAAGLVERLIVIGEGAAGIADAARRAGLPPEAVLPVADRGAAQDALRRWLQPGDVVLVKASRGAALDLLVESIREEWSGKPPGGTAG